MRHILSQNSHSQIGGTGNADISHNLLDGTSSILGTEAITGNPMFVDPQSGDFSLLPKSPAIDAGTELPLSTDFAGKPRPAGRGYDAGALEFAPNPPAPPRISKSLAH